jgi:hypothetical protein
LKKAAETIKRRDLLSPGGQDPNVTQTPKTPLLDQVEFLADLR